MPTYKKLSPSIPVETVEELAANYRSANAGATRAIRSWMRIKEATMSDLRNFLSPGELETVRSAHIGRRFDETTAGNRDCLINAMSQFLERMRENAAEPAESLLEKLDELTPAECFFLTEYATEGK